MINSEDVEINKFICINLYKLCWHEFGIDNEVYCQYCGVNMWCNQNSDYVSNIAIAWEAVAKLSKFMLEQDEDIAEEMYRAFASRIKKECLVVPNMGDYQKLDNAEIFLLYLATPKTICLAIKDALEAKGK